MSRIDIYKSMHAMAIIKIKTEMVKKEEMNINGRYQMKDHIKDKIIT